ncbi:MAG: MIP family channel protein [Gaiellaceae bacterium]|jgi:aquaporin TIP|nr:MIP family channel protein [Acidobacteriota bacterium]
MDYDPLRRGVAEFVGTFTLVFIGAGAILTSTKLFAAAFAQGAGDTASGLGLVAIALAHGLAIAVMVSAVGHISGGHFNPAVTLGFLVTRRLAPMLALTYWAAQFAAATLAALLLRAIYPQAVRNVAHLGAPGLGGGVTPWQGFVIEVVLTFFLVWVVFATAADPGGTFKSIAGLAIGLTITLDICMGGPLTGAAMNPARAFGPELVQRDWTNAWIWYAGPVVGAALAALAYEFLYLRPVRPLVPVGPPESGVIEPRPGETSVT